MFVRARPIGFWIFGSVIDPLELEGLDRDRANSLDGKNGGAYSLLAALVLGGAGLTLAGTNHHVSGTVTVDNLALIKVVDGGTVKADGTGGADIALKVVSGVALLDVESGAAIRIKSGGSLDVLGALAVKDGATLTAEDGSVITISSGAIFTAADGSTVNLSGTTNVRGAFVLKASGGPGSFTQEAGTTALFQGDTVFSGASSITYNSGAEVNGLITRKGTEVRDGATARTAKRPTVTLSASANEDVTVEADDYRVPQTLTGSRTYTVRHTGTVPREGEEIWLYRTGTTTPSAHTALFVREDSTVIAAFFNSRQGWFRLKFDGTGWQCVGGGQYASGDTGCGYYDNVW